MQLRRGTPDGRRRSLETAEQLAVVPGWAESQRAAGLGSRANEDLVATRLKERRRTGWTCDSFYSGAYLLDTLPCAFYILAQDGAGAEEAIARANDKTQRHDCRNRRRRYWHAPRRRGLAATVAGRLTGRTAIDDDGRMFDVIA